MMRFVRDFGRLLIAMLLINLLLIWLLSISGTWSRWASNISNRRDTLRGGVLDTPQGVAMLSESLPATVTSHDDLLHTAQIDPDLTIATQLIESAASATSLPQPITVFLPTDQAFMRLPAESVDAILANPTAAADLLHRHMAAGMLPASRLSQMQSLPRLSGQSLTIEETEAGVRVDYGNVHSADLAYNGGILHKIDRVLLPSDTVAIDTPDGVTELDYTGRFITINGSGQPNTLLILHDGREHFGNALINAEGRWSLSGNLAAGRHELVAYMVQPTDSLPLAASVPIVLTSSVEEEGK